MTNSSPREFRILPLPEAEARSLLQRQRVGRLAFPAGNRVEIRPVGYVSDGDWLFGRMQEGEKVEALLHHRWVAFHVDEIHSPWQWESVLIHGPLQFLDPDGGEEMASMHARALAVLSAHVPHFQGAEDPGAFRTILFGITVQEMAGRRGVLNRAP